MKNQALYNALDIDFPDIPPTVGGDEIVINFEGATVTLNQAGLLAYRNERAKGNAFRKAMVLGVNALSYVDGERDLYPYESVAYSKNRAVTVCFEHDHEEVLAFMQGARAVWLCVTPPVPKAMTRNDLSSWDDVNLFAYSEFQKDDAKTNRHLKQAD